jgi:hypothetical protein
MSLSTKVIETQRPQLERPGRPTMSLRYFLARRNLAKLYATSDHAFKFVSQVGEI